MSKSIASRTKFILKMMVLACSLICVFMLAACGSGGSAEAPEEDGQGQASVEGNETVKVRIGTMPTEDILPMWVAQEEDIFSAQGVDAEIITFDSAQALSAAISADEVDMAMVDIMRAVKLYEAGTPVVLEWVTLGTEAEQGRFGVMAAADMPYSNLQELAAYAADNQLAGGGVGIASNTVPEYVFDMLCEQAGVSPDAIPTQEIASLPERYGLMASGNLAAAALPGSLLALGEANGLKVLAEDTEGDNVSQSVMIATESFADFSPEAILKVAHAWDDASAAIDLNPQSYVSLLVDKANLNETIAESYPIGTYPLAMSDDEIAHPDKILVLPIIQWMSSKGYSNESITYNQTTGMFSLE